MHRTCLLVFQHINVVRTIETILRDMEELNDVIRRSKNNKGHLRIHFYIFDIMFE